MDIQTLPSIFIGNGINKALKLINTKAEINFDYESIFQEVLSRLSTDNLELCDFLNMAEKNNNKDLEYLLLILKNSDECLKYATNHYCTPTPDCSAKINQYRDVLKKTVIEILTDSHFHPSYQAIFGNDFNNPPEYIKQCGKNLRNFERIFTINYDLILYWLMNHQGLLTKANSTDVSEHGYFKDGFSQENCYFLDNTNEVKEHLCGLSMNNNHPNFFYLHGALHLIQKNNSAYKIVRKGSNMTLSDLRDFLLEKFPNFDSLIIFDATNEEKVDTIFANAYLNKAYDKITPIKGDIIIYGCNFLDNSETKINLGNDIHLWQKIINSDTHNLFVSLGKEGSELDTYNQELGGAFKRLKVKPNIDMNIHCFSYHDVDIWKSDNFYDEVIRCASKAYRLN